jgi:hypothetical protein
MIGNLLNRLRRGWAKIQPRIIPTLRRTRLTQIALVLIMAAGIYVEVHGDPDWATLLQKFGWDLTTIQQGRIYAAWVGLLFSNVLNDFIGILVLVAVTVGILEYRRGTLIAAMGFLIIGPLASVASLLLLWPISNAGVEYVRVALFTPDLGASTACLVCLGILLMGLKGRIRIILILFILAVLAAVFYKNERYNIDHLSGYLIGLAAGAIIERWRRPKRQPTPIELKKKHEN